jgi:hypothetical protein
MSAKTAGNSTRSEAASWLPSRGTEPRSKTRLGFGSIVARMRWPDNADDLPSPPERSKPGFCQAFRLIPPTGFEPVISRVKGSEPRGSDARA